MEIKNLKIAIVGGGNLGRSVADGFLKSGISASKLTVSRRRIQLLDDLAAKGIRIVQDNKAAVAQADMIIISGSINYKMAPVLKRLYDQMADPKYVIAMGACAVSGGPFFYNSYAIVKGADHVIPVDVYIPGCPPRPEALLYGIMQLQKKIKCHKNFGKTKFTDVKPL